MVHPKIGRMTAAGVITKTGAKIQVAHAGMTIAVLVAVGGTMVITTVRRGPGKEEKLNQKVVRIKILPRYTVRRNQSESCDAVIRYAPL